MLYEFLRDHRETILVRSRDRIRREAGQQVTDADLSEGVPVFLDQLGHVLRREGGAPSESGQSPERERSAIDEAAARYGEALLRLGFTISQVVRGYGAVCQTITGLLDELSIGVTTREYETFNACLDSAIAEAVTAYEALTDRNVAAREVEHLGTLAHELRNALTAAVTTVELLKLNLIGFSGRAPTTLENALRRMRDLIDRSLAEVRLRASLEPQWEEVRLADVFDYVNTTAAIDAQPRALVMRWDVEPSLHVEADRQLLVSAVTNLVQTRSNIRVAGARSKSAPDTPTRTWSSRWRMRAAAFLKEASNISSKPTCRGGAIAPGWGSVCPSSSDRSTRCRDTFA